MTVEVPGAATVSIRPMTRADVAEVAAIEARSVTDGWNEALFAGEFAVPELSRAWFVATAVDGGVVAFCGLLYVAGSDPVEAHVMNLAVDPPLRRCGLARLLLSHALLAAAERGVEAVTLEVRASNVAAIALYGSLGFRHVGERRGYYPDGEDAQILWLDDPGRLAGA